MMHGQKTIKKISHEWVFIFVSEWIPHQVSEFLPLLVTTRKIILIAIQNHVKSQSYPLNSCGPE
jgi:hypothetical protein